MRDAARVLAVLIIGLAALALLLLGIQVAPMVESGDSDTVQGLLAMVGAMAAIGFGFVLWLLGSIDERLQSLQGLGPVDRRPPASGLDPS